MSEGVELPRTSGDEGDLVPPENDAPPLEARAVEKIFPLGEVGELRVLAGVNLRVERGEAVAIIGASGTGKSTLLQLLGALDRPTAGEVLVGGRPISGLSNEELAAVRNRHIGFVFQFHHLLREFSAVENVAMPLMIAGVDQDRSLSKAQALLEGVGLGERLGHRPGQLSGGEQQRVAVARAMANEPMLLLADEPSGNLDHHTSEHLHDVLFAVREERDLSMVLVTHNMELARRADRVLRLEDGLLEDAALA